MDRVALWGGRRRRRDERPAETGCSARTVGTLSARRPAVLATILSLGVIVVQSCGDTQFPVNGDRGGAPGAAGTTGAAGMTGAAGTSLALSAPPSLTRCTEYSHIDATNCAAGSAHFTTHVWSMAFSPSGGQLATAGEDGVIKIWKMKGAVPTKTSMLSTFGQAFVAYSPDGRLFAEGSTMGDLELYDASTFTLLAKLAGHPDDITALGFTADSKYLWVLDVNGRLTRHDIGGSTTPAVTVEMGVYGSALAVSPVATPTSQWLAVGFTNGVANIVNLNVPTAPVTTNITVSADGLGVSMMSFSPDGSSLVAGGSDGIVGFWTIPPPTDGARSSGTISIPDSRGAPLWITGVKYSPDGKSLLISAGDAISEWKLAIWDPVTRTQRASIVPTYEPFTVAWAPSQGIIAAGEGTCGQIIVCSDD
jgi:WD40 repeat protein